MTTRKALLLICVGIGSLLNINPSLSKGRLNESESGIGHSRSSVGPTSLGENFNEEEALQAGLQNPENKNNPPAQIGQGKPSSQLDLYEFDVTHILRLAEAGDVNAQYTLGSMHTHGIGVLKDEKAAFEWFEKAAHQNHPESQFNLGVAYDTGRVVPKDEEKAFNWYQESAHRGCPSAQYNLGWMYDTGEGVPQNDEAAFEWYQKAADQHHVKARFNLGVMYEIGQGVPKDEGKAEAWYQKAADQGHAKAQTSLNRLRNNRLPTSDIAGRPRSATSSASTLKPPFAALYEFPTQTFAITKNIIHTAGNIASRAWQGLLHTVGTSLQEATLSSPSYFPNITSPLTNDWSSPHAYEENAQAFLPGRPFLAPPPMPTLLGRN